MSFLKWIEKNPLEAAALGTAAYFTGGAALGAMGGGAGAAAGAAGAGAAGAGAAGTAAAGAGAAGAAGAGATGAAGAAQTGGGLLSTLGSIGQAAGAANQIQGLLGSGSAPMQAPQVQPGNAQGAQTLAQLYQQGMQLSPEDQARMQRKTMWG